MFFVGLFLTVLAIAAAVLLLYARGLAKAQEEPLWPVLKSIVTEILKGEFFQ